MHRQQTAAHPPDQPFASAGGVPVPPSQLPAVQRASCAGSQRLHPRQHQLLLQIAGLPEGRSATINFLAERLGCARTASSSWPTARLPRAWCGAVEDPATAAACSLCHPQGDGPAGRLVGEPCARVGRVRATAHSHSGTHQAPCVAEPNGTRPSELGASHAAASGANKPAAPRRAR